MFKRSLFDHSVIFVSVFLCMFILSAPYSFGEDIQAGQVGCDAPKLSGLQWVKGDAVEMKEDSVYVIEFWATWCGPCIAGIPHLTELQHSYKDKKVTVIGISGEKIDAVKPFVEKRGDQMSYTVAVDTTGDINKAYMKAFGQSGIPHAFIVDQKGQIAWHGHPMEMDDILEQVAAGDFDGIAHEKQKAGETAKAEQDYKDNLAALEKKLADNENDVDSLIAYGFLLIQERKSIPYAHKTFLKAIELDPEKCAAVDDVVINILIKRGEVQAKLAKINTALEKDPENIKLLIKHAETYLDNSFVTELSYQPHVITYALADYKKVLELDPEDKNNVAQHIHFFEAWGKWGGTRHQEFKDFYEKYPNSIRKPFVAYALYNDANAEGDIETALKYLREIEKAKLDSEFGRSILETIEQLQKIVDRRAAKKPGTIGSAAADLSDLKWVKGNPVKFEKDSVYVVEFWATWCGPCIAGIPHLTELQHKYKDKNVTVIGISSETVDKVKPFVDKKGKEMGYTVAVDTDGEMNKAYMKAFGQGGIPHAFIVDKEGIIAWHGHPMMMDEVLEGVANGTFDSVAYAKQQAEAKEKAERARKNYTAYFENVANKSEAKEIGLKFIEDGYSQTLNSFAWQILTEVEEGNRDIKMALRAAKKANDLEEGSSPAILDTYALALFEAGKIQGAVKRQKMAVELSESNERMHAELKQTLDKYVAALKEKKSAS